MNWFSKIFSSIGGEVIRSIGGVLDDLTTSDEEIALTEIQKLKIERAYEQRIRALMLDADRLAADSEQKAEAERTKRQELDMKSDSWLSKNIRPMVMIYMTGVVSIMAFATIFTADLNEGQLETIEQWIPFFQVIMITIYGFYFGSRCMEKISKIKNS